MIKVVLDTNIWISYLITDRFRFIDQLIYGNRLKLIFSDELLEEFITVAQRPKFRKYFTDSDITALLDLIEFFGIYIIPTSDVKMCRDEKDNFLLNLAIDSKADFLVTGDLELLGIKEIGKTRIISMNELKSILTIRFNLTT